MVYCLESELGSGCLMQCCLVYCLVFELVYEYWKLYCLVCLMGLVSLVCLFVVGECAYLCVWWGWALASNAAIVLYV